MTIKYTSPPSGLASISSSKVAGLLLWIIQDPQVYIALQKLYFKRGQASIAYLIEHADTLDLDEIDDDFDQKFGATAYSWDTALEELACKLIERDELELPLETDNLLVYGNRAFANLDALWLALEGEWVATKVSQKWVIVERS